MHDPFTVEVDSKDVRELLYEDVSHLHCTHHHPIVLCLQHGGYEAVQEEEGKRRGKEMEGEEKRETRMERAGSKKGERKKESERRGRRRGREKREEEGGQGREERGGEGEKQDKEEGVRGVGDGKACEHLTYWMYIPGYADLLQDIRQDIGTVHNMRVQSGSLQQQHKVLHMYVQGYPTYSV